MASSARPSLSSEAAAYQEASEEPRASATRNSTSAFSYPSARKASAPATRCDSDGGTAVPAATSSASTAGRTGLTRHRSVGERRAWRGGQPLEAQCRGEEGRRKGRARALLLPVAGIVLAGRTTMRIAVGGAVSAGRAGLGRAGLASSVPGPVARVVGLALAVSVAVRQLLR